MCILIILLIGKNKIIGCSSEAERLTVVKPYGLIFNQNVGISKFPIRAKHTYSDVA
jgi:hypothetical protein